MPTGPCALLVMTKPICQALNRMITPFTPFANERDIKDILDELATVRKATISLFEGFDSKALTRSGMADGRIMSVRAAHIISPATKCGT